MLAIKKGMDSEIFYFWYCKKDKNIIFILFKIKR